MNMALSKELKSKLEGISQKNILISEKYGKKIIKSLKSGQDAKKCDRRDCKICLHGGNKEQCYKSNWGYRIV